ncbi:ABC transporter permease [Mucilaginibacter daejeonensis]|uniref:ABC transporter permease n=1 Tax=Mucilaginibacter daejeonensis TaxID=398049 RepID=UPI001D176FA8|nr:ABC transporter permease [Mucilaginibacter daejeonensis]UEG55160.1 ABC transporter permease [Mucilaginibacter daejeonensis]
MFGNHLKIAFRSLWRNKAFSVINVLGLVLGFTVLIFIAEYIAYEWSANRDHKDLKQIYRLSFLYKDGKSNYYMPPGIGARLATDVSGVKACVRIGDNIGNGVVAVTDASGSKKVFREEKVSFTDDSFFKVFSFPLVSGSGRLNEPQTTAISQSVAQKYFGGVDAVGKVIEVNNQFGQANYTVTGVYQDMAQNSDIKADILLSFKTIESAAFRNSNDWADPNTFDSEYAFIYLLADEHADQAHLADQATQLLHQLKPDTQNDKLGLQPLSELHIAPSFNYPFQTFGSLTLMISFISVAMLVMVIAWVNYINLSTAQALNRAKDVGVRKVLGAARSQLSAQYLIETVVLTVIGLAVALLLVLCLQSTYNGILEKQLSLSIFDQWWIWAGGGAMIVTGTLIAGGYVAWVLSSFDPLVTIRSKALISIGGVSLRRGLVVFQFATSIVFIVATIVLYDQLKYMRTQDLGMNVDQRLVITGPSVINSSQIDHSLAFEADLRQLPFVKQVAASNNVPGQGYNFSAAGITNMQPAPGDDKFSYAMLIVDNDFFSTYDIKIKNGSGFSPAMLEHGWPKTKKVILNEAAVKQLRYKDDASVIGKKIKWRGDFEVVGVVKDYHHLGLHEQIKPMIFLPAVADGFFTLKIDQRDLPARIEQIRRIYQKNFPAEPFNYSFLDEVYDKQYKAEYQLGNIFIAAAGTTVFIACLGLLGLAMFAAKQRTKEIGIRKVLGASVIDLIDLISADLLKMVMIAMVIAWPVAWLIMDKWLQNFAYRIHMQWWMLVAGGALALLIALLTVSFQAMKAATLNPVNTLRNE